MSGECYQIFFNNQSSNCQNNASYNDEQKYNLNYTVNWGAILPKKINFLDVHLFLNQSFIVA